MVHKPSFVRIIGFRMDLAFRASMDFIKDSPIPPKQKLLSLTNNNNWDFPPAMLHHFPDLRLIDPPSQSSDTNVWIPSPTGKFSLSHTVEWLAPHFQPEEWHQLVWNSFSIPRCKFTLWLAVQRRLSTYDC
ncbi:uncharacterized protein LOC132281270 [Cornus florida]|uniref:uncharacterized protein LOC132281270 n=1 Tax=Cornus florida TaxID=4283 RepID=UPI00289D1FA8|nr:uncharacterized protein LOC132281270 [Cornus florida]